MSDYLADNAPFIPAPEPRLVGAFVRDLRRIGAQTSEWALALPKDGRHRTRDRRCRCDGCMVKVIQADMKELDLACDRVSLAYVEAYDIAYTRTVRGDGSSGQIDQSDPTGNVATASRQRYLRRGLVVCAAKSSEALNNISLALFLTKDYRTKPVSSKVADALSNMRQAWATLDRAMERDGIDVDRDNARVKEQLDRGIIPPKAPAIELQAYAEAQRRRLARGEQSEALGIGPQ